MDPLNIFEKRYLDLVNDTYKKDKLIVDALTKIESGAVSSDLISVPGKNLGVFFFVL
mgnify:CR=1 FL=1